MVNLQRVILLGGGASILDGIKIGLFDKIKNEIVYCLNYSAFVIKPDMFSFVDKTFFEEKRDEILKLDCIKIARNKPSVVKNEKNKKYIKNIFFFDTDTKYYGKESIEKNKIYHSFLVGLFSLTVCISLGFEEIFLLGFDGCRVKGKTHFYQEKIFHRGIGELAPYERINERFFVYSDEKNIFNVNPGSKINIFPKIEYNDFFDRIKNNPIINKRAQIDSIRNILRKACCGVSDVIQ